MSIRYVRSGGATSALGADAYTDPSRPAGSLRDAIRAAAAGDVVRILDHAVYAEGEIVVDKPLTIESAAALGTGPKPVDDKFDPAAYPTLRPRSGRPSRVLRIQASGPDPKHNAVGKVVLRGLTITGGRTTGAPEDAAQNGGAGIAVIDEDDVLVDQCCIRKNTAPAPPLKRYSTVEFKALVRRRIVEMVSGLGGVVDTAALDAQIRQRIDAKLPNLREDSFLFAQGSGGGVGLFWSGATVRACRIEQNTSGGRGGGIGVIGYGWPHVEGCLIKENRAGAQETARKDGGGIGIEIALPDKLGRGLTESALLTDVSSWLRGRTVNELRRLGVATLAGGVFGEISQFVKSAPPNSFVDLCVYALSSRYLGQVKDDRWDAKSLEAARNNRVVIDACRFRSNVADDDGGGLYASVLSRTRVTSSAFEKNRAAGGAGGGMRVSMGSDTAVTACSFVENSSEGSSLASGGGAIACRNSALEISGTEGHPTEVTRNWTAEYAGGGVFVQNISEGTIGGVPDLWHTILKVVFGISEAKTTIRAGARIASNVAGMRRSKSGHGKGGGLYLLRGTFREAFDLDVEIERFDQQIRGNTARSGATPVVTGGTRRIRTDEVDLVDVPARVDDGDAEAKKHLGSGLLTSGTTFRYES